MENISIKMTASELQVLVNHSLTDKQAPPTNYTAKAVQSMMEHVFKQLQKKLIAKRQTNKPFKMNFSYHNAYALNQWLAWIPFDANPHNNLSIRSVIGQIDQQL